tara:strand:- start:992 stop:1933 length:942 start_codon:yes stop_codon:yes gene_type:complete
MKQNETISRKIPQANFRCNFCDVSFSRKNDYDRHITTRKHQLKQNETKIPQKSVTPFMCLKCNKVLKSRTSYWRHTKNCCGENEVICETITSEVEEASDTKDKDVIMLLLKQNQEFKELIVSQNNQIVELSKNGSTNNSYNHTNSHNKTFNLSFFLNETCKDAMNITDFVNSLKLSLNDLESVGELGYAEGISRMFVKGLNDLEVTKRPIHCSDLKRETLHIKDKDIWEKDNPNQDKLKKAIKDLSNKNIMLFDDWQRENPGYDQYDNKKNDIYLRMMVQAMGPADQVAEKRDFGKIIRSIAKNTIIDKDVCV